jgi:hypothetical protein
VAQAHDLAQQIHSTNFASKMPNSVRVLALLILAKLFARQLLASYSSLETAPDLTVMDETDFLK